MENKWLTPEEHKLMVEKTVICCTDVIVLYKNQFLLVKRSNPPVKDSLWFPGSRLQKEERIADAAVRVCKEEVGLDVVYRRQLGVEETIFEKDGMYEGITTHSVNVICLVEAKSGNVTLDEHHSEFRWIPIGGPYPDNLHKCLKDFISLAFLEV